MLKLGVDEITVVLQLSACLKPQLAVDDWGEIAKYLIGKFEDKSGFGWIFGRRQPQESPPKGYAVAYQYGEHNFYLAVAYHPFYPQMGVAIRFSAQALDYYCDRRMVKVYQFIQMIQDSDYTTRLSRIDLTADYIDEGIDVTEIYQTLMDKKVDTFRENIKKATGEKSFIKVPFKLTGYLKEREVPTIYLGSVQSNSRLRIYDKRREQIERKGTKFDEAIKCKSWVRFEGVFRGDYAHQITDELQKIQSDDEYANLIALTLAQKFRFMVLNDGIADTATDYTQMLLDSIKNKNFKLKTLSSKNFELARNIAYIFHGSGIMNSLYKVKSIWDLDAVKYLLEYMVELLDMDEGGYQPNEDCIYWLRKNEADYKLLYPDFIIFLM